MALIVFDEDHTRLKHILRHFMKYLFSHIGLFGLVLAYCVGGAYLFAFIESPNVESKIRATVNVSHRLEAQRRNLIDFLYQEKCSPNFNETLYQMVEEYQRSVADAIQNHGYIGVTQEETDIINGWVFPSALLFTITIVTTIGYGHVVPKTALGQMITIPYSLLGIPLMLMFLANIGDFMARCFRLGYTRGCCFVCWRRRKLNFNSDKERRNQSKQSQIESGLSTKDEKMGKSEKASDLLSLASPSADSDSDNFPDELPDDEFLNVPISLSIVVAVLYLFIGAVLFAAWNGWTWIQGGYFSFITLATIGFGDYIPGWQEASTTIGRIKLVISCLYIVFGLAVLSMSFNLMMDEMISKFKWLGRQIGLIKRVELLKATILDQSVDPDTDADADEKSNGEKTSQEIKIESETPQTNAESEVIDVEELEEIRKDPVQ